MSDDVSSARIEDARRLVEHRQASFGLRGRVQRAVQQDELPGNARIVAPVQRAAELHRLAAQRDGPVVDLEVVVQLGHEVERLELGGGRVGEAGVDLARAEVEQLQRGGRACLDGIRLAAAVGAEQIGDEGLHGVGAPRLRRGHLAWCTETIVAPDQHGATTLR